ncbi:HNH endonuclease family protein [Cellulomonas edaphi]|uniref:HNH endonuclease family protein n=1 Tax=Cellulomonas edaphi TaxID=3053468 RepID=A0ABT7S3P6_9CELL|nr:HNH endonuclease family protein [Cellulomons edaphi]MDM7830248.1 HNH endonuclease family protein [Cellulomons edaphi]
MWERVKERVREQARGRAVWAALLAACLVVGLGGPWWARTRSLARFPVSSGDLSAGQAALAALPVRAPASSDGYERSRFGAAWADEDHNGCDTRDDVLARDLAGAVRDACTVLRGVLDDPYTGERIVFARGPGSAEVQIDHVVALADAWRTGAAQWTAARRRSFANDPANLLAVAGGANQDKGASDASAWLPPLVGYRCVYVLRQVRVKAAYGLWVTPDERGAMRRELGRCVVGR